MELILNLLWLMLAVPACWLWRREGRFDYRCPHFGSLRSVLVLGCVLMLLFPVVSATDDLHFLRPEMEESSPSRRTLKQVGSDKASTWIRGYVPDLAEATEAAPLAPAQHICGQSLIYAVRPFSAVFVDARPG